MFARILTVQFAPERVEEAGRRIRENVLPRARQMPGVVAGYWLADPRTGKGLTTLLAETEEALRAAEEVSQESRARSLEMFGGTLQSNEVHEVFGLRSGRGPRRLAPVHRRD